MPLDPTVILNRGTRVKAGATAAKHLSGRLTADGVEFAWEAKPLRGLWFVSVHNATCGSRSQVTPEDPINFALQLAKQLAASGS